MFKIKYFRPIELFLHRNFGQIYEVVNISEDMEYFYIVFNKIVFLGKGNSKHSEKFYYRLLKYHLTRLYSSSNIGLTIDEAPYQNHKTRLL